MRLTRLEETFSPEKRKSFANNRNRLVCVLTGFIFLKLLIYCRLCRLLQKLVATHGADSASIYSKCANGNNALVETELPLVGKCEMFAFLNSDFQRRKFYQVCFTCSGPDNSHNSLSRIADYPTLHVIASHCSLCKKGRRKPNNHRELSAAVQRSLQRALPLNGKHVHHMEIISSAAQHN